MKTHLFSPSLVRNLRLIGRCLPLVLLIALSGCCRIFWRPSCGPRIVTQPQSQTVPKGTPVTFTVVTSPPATFYQWQFNGVDIPGATTNSYSIANANFSNVGAYRVRVWGSPTNTSETAYLSVFETTVNGGVLSYPIGYFSGQSFTCPSGGTFQQGYVATNPDDGTIGLFYGPSATSPRGIFQNTANLPRLAIDTFHSDNGIADTGLRLRNNWGTLATAACNDNATGGTDPKQSRVEIILTATKSYRLTLFYKNTPGAPASGKVTFNWQYLP